ncbi:MAG TPA: ester cyclase [Phenylobacterium sp.]|nr:ester cyclase [Phenylobacterium sp.]
MSDRRKQILTCFIEEVWNRGDGEAAADYLAMAYTIRHDPGDPWDGRTLDLAQFRERLAAARAPFPDQRFETQALIAENDAVVMTWTWSATHVGDLPGYPATGRRISMSGATVYGFDAADRLTGHWQIKDALGVFRQLSAAA